MCLNVYAGLLTMFDSFELFNYYDLAFSYSLIDESYDRLKDKYSIDRVAGSQSKLSQAINLLHWISENIYHKGNYDGSLPNDAITMLDYSYKAGAASGINCRSLSTILTECCLSIGIMARSIHLMPCSPYDGDSHVVTLAYITDMDKWIMLDPTYNCYVMNREGDILDIFEIRKALSRQDCLFFCDEMNYNGQISDIMHKEITNYYAKNMFYYWCRKNSTYGADSGKGGEMIVCSPDGYNVDKARRANLQYLITMTEYPKYTKIWKSEASEPNLYVSENVFMRSPI